MSARRWSCCLGVAGVLFGTLGGCPKPPTGVTGDPNAGQTEFAQLCSACHTPATVSLARSRITNNMGSINAAMSGITLTDQQVVDLQAYLATK